MSKLTNSNNKKALIAMSGGVDSSVAAAKMIQEGYESIGCTMRLYNNEDIGLDRTKTCCSLDDVEDARSVAYKLNMQFYVFNLSDEFKDKVINNFLECYSVGVTPNPCIECNRYLKFEKLFERAEILGCDKVVTGHYARVCFNEQTDLYELRKGVDPAKDQSYVLYMLTQNQLEHILFPIGDMKKEETRQIAEDNGFVNAHKQDSQDICFIPDGDYQGFLCRNGVKCKPGNFVTKDGEILGKHTGICNYTIGQRKGLGISSTHPYYVKDINSKENVVVLSDNESLFDTVLTARNVSFTMPLDKISKDGHTIRCLAKIRYRHKESPATVTLLENDRIEVVFDEPQRAITPGQAVVLYDGEVVLGGGTIE